jgi:hypothetical protein
MDLFYLITSSVAILLNIHMLFKFNGFVKSNKAKIFVYLYVIIVGIYLTVRNLNGPETVDYFLFTSYIIINNVLADYYIKWRRSERIAEATKRIESYKNRIK